MNNRCVYFLYDKFGVIRYIGEGTYQRAFDYSHKTRSEEFKNILNDGGKIVIKHERLSKQEAMTIEKEYLSKYNEGILENSNLLNKMSGRSCIDLKYDELSKVFALSSESKTGLIWIIDRIKSNGRLCSKARVGYTAGCLPDEKRRSCLILNNRTLLVHRIIWVLHNKRDLKCDMVINHIDGNYYNNSPDNLEAVTQKINILKTVNRSIQNSMGIVGVRYIFKNRIKRSVSSYYCDLNGKQIVKSYSIKRNGEFSAIKLAVDWRKDRLIETYGLEETKQVVYKMYNDFVKVCETGDLFSLSESDKIELSKIKEEFNIE